MWRGGRQAEEILNRVQNEGRASIGGMVGFLGSLASILSFMGVSIK